MPPNTLRVHTEYVLVKSLGPNVLWAVATEIAGAGGCRIFLSPPVPCLNCGGGDRRCRRLSCEKSNLSQALTTFIPSLQEEHDNIRRICLFIPFLPQYITFARQRGKRGVGERNL
ncbi:hypothetical protein TNCV_4610141 [Trichonephila clavipes]|nr:hypothetical protein TNCV_4610141 [Trichonephila clavipes]